MTTDFNTPESNTTRITALLALRDNAFAVQGISAFKRLTTKLPPICLRHTLASNVISLARTCINANEFAPSNFEEGAKAARIAETPFANTEQGMKRRTDTELAVTQSSRALTQFMAANSLAEASDTTQKVVKLQVQMTALRKDITELTTRLRTLRYKPSPDLPKNLDANGNPLAPSVDGIDLYPPEPSSGGTRWQEIYMKQTVDPSTTPQATRVLRQREVQISACSSIPIIPRAASPE